MPLFLKKRFDTFERVFDWEDKFDHLLLRFDRISDLHYAFKPLTDSMTDSRYFYQG
jgi:hypothetical protein